MSKLQENIERQLFEVVGEEIRKALEDNKKEVGAGRCLTASLIGHKILKTKGVETKVVYGDFEGNSHTWLELQKNGETYVVDFVASDFNVSPEELRKIKESKWFTEEYKQKVSVKNLPDTMFVNKKDFRIKYPNAYAETGIIDEKRVDELLADGSTKKVLSDVTKKSEFQKYFEGWESHIKTGKFPKETSYV